MRSERVTITIDETGAFAMRTWQRNAASGEFVFALPKAFSPEDVRAALLATGWVEVRAGELQLVNWMGCEAIGPFVEEMFSYFVRRGEPREELLRVRDTVAASTPSHVLAAIPLWAFAWLDLVVRDDLADTARSVHDVWSERSILLHVDDIRRERVHELLARYGSPAIANLAPSVRHRRESERRFKRGG